MSEDGPGDPFESAESYYADHRPGYGEAPFESLTERFALDVETSRALDLGCGAGQITLPLAARVGTAVGMDPNKAMLEQARRRARDRRIENVEWVVGSDADLGGDLGPVDVTTMGRAFHWMDRGPTLDRIFELTAPGGGVAIFGDTEWLTSGERAWQDEVYAAAASYLDDLPERTGPRTEPYENPYDELLADHGFADVETATFERTREWSVDGIVGYVFSLSFCSPATFGDEKAAFEAELRERLAELGGPFEQGDEVRVISGRKPA
ncbi:methyltransferase domain-containing protein [Halosimplex rubrum]|uniref:Methyltransferase domain-containing protein n=1 Tax=Halosimplex rubrum TaxID=869889 RepID=A0A7D5TLP0_9EURY|nr:class I SAM-dependent methyltransferase [Halosimplex rubrum]QLH77712.1 methyltransferase domain-containing protein [Halosimplex rubrum]